jgi:hypothetical protein
MRNARAGNTLGYLVKETNELKMAKLKEGLNFNESRIREIIVSGDQNTHEKMNSCAAICNGVKDGDAKTFDRMVSKKAKRRLMLPIDYICFNDATISASKDLKTSGNVVVTKVKQNIEDKEANWNKNKSNLLEYNNKLRQSNSLLKSIDHAYSLSTDLRYSAVHVNGKSNTVETYLQKKREFRETIRRNGMHVSKIEEIVLLLYL